MAAATDGQQLCRTYRDDCPNGPEPHAYHPPELEGLPCCRQPGEEAEPDDYEPCDHSHDEDCYDYQGFFACRHQHCFACGGCGCPGYCDDYQTYNLRPDETGGAPATNTAARKD